MMECKGKRLFTPIALGLGLTLAAVWLLGAGGSKATLAQAGTGIICVATTGIDALGCGSVVSPCRTPQFAVMLADAGDEVRVATGVYTGVQIRDGSRQLLLITKSLTIRGGYDAAFEHAFPFTQPTVLDAEGKGRVIYIDPALPTVEGFWIVRGNASDALLAEAYGGGIYSSGGAPTIINNVISGNVAYTGTAEIGCGGGVFVWDVWDTWGDAHVVISGNQVISNIANTSKTGHGGGLYIGHADGVQVIDNAVLSNTACVSGGQGSGGGIYLTDSDGAILHGNRVENNAAQRESGSSANYGGGISCVSSAHVIFDHNEIRHNAASVVMPGGFGGGIYASEADRMRLEGNILEGNRSAPEPYGAAGALFLNRADGFQAEANWVLSNVAGFGGGLYVLDDIAFTLTNNIVAGNAAWTGGGSLEIRASANAVSTGTLLHNTFAASNEGNDQGQTAIWAQNASLVLTNNLIYSHAYGIYGLSSSSAELYHTLFYANDHDTGGSGAFTHTSSITGADPRLDASYHLLSDSPAIDAGVEAGVVTDIDGDPRPYGSGPDIGADEFVRRLLFLPIVHRQDSTAQEGH